MEDMVQRSLDSSAKFVRTIDRLAAREISVFPAPGRGIYRRTPTTTRIHNDASLHAAKLAALIHEELARHLEKIPEDCLKITRDELRKAAATREARSQGRLPRRAADTLPVNRTKAVQKNGPFSWPTPARQPSGSHGTP